MKRGEKLFFHMERKGFNPSTLAKESKVPYTTIRSMIEKDLVNSSVDNVIKLCRVLDITVEDLLEEEPNNSIDERVVSINSLRTTNYKYLPVKISAGIPNEVESVMQAETITIPDELLGKYAGCEDVFFMRVNGESMNKIIPHDSLIAVKKVTVEELKNGDIVVYSNGYDYSVKMFYKIEDKFIFKPNSTDPRFTDHTLDRTNEELRLHGKVITYIVNTD